MMKLVNSPIFGYNTTILSKAGLAYSLAALVTSPVFLYHNAVRFFGLVMWYSKENKKRRKEMSESEKRFLEMIHDPALRANLLVRLEKLELLSAFLEIENGTT